MTWAGDTLVRCCNCMDNVPSSILCILVYILQSALMDYYLCHYLSTVQLLWLSADIVNLCLLLVCIVMANTSLKNKRVNENADVTTLGWIVWFFCAVTLAAKIVVIFVKASYKMDEKDPTFFGPNTLKTTIAVSSIIFLLLLTTQHDAPLASESRRYIEELTGTVVFDLLDTVDILEVLFDEETRKTMWNGLAATIMAVATFNLLIPTLPLFTLSMTKFGKKKLNKNMIYTHRLILALIINMPNLIIRMIIWHGLSAGISPFFLKNVILICMTCFEFYEHKKEKYEEYEHEMTEMKNGRNNNGRSQFNASNSAHGKYGEVKDRNSPVHEGFAIESRMVVS